MVLACDLGGTSFRAALVDETGAMRAETALPAPASRDRMGRSEVDPGAWWSVLVAACGHLAAAQPALFAAIEGVAICGITRTQVFLDADGRSLRPAMTWNDNRAQDAAARMRARLPAGHREGTEVNAYHPVARLAWLHEAEPANFRRLACVLEPKDYLNFCLTGMQAGDPVSMARLLASCGTGPDLDLLAAIGKSQAILPPMLDPCDRVGPVLAGLPAPLDALAGVPVFCASNDTWTGVVGLGAMRMGVAYNLSGTTEVLGLMSDQPHMAEGLLTVDWRGLYQLGGPSQNGADTLTWLLSLLAGENEGTGPVGPALDALLSRTRHEQPVLFLPYLQGERVPYWDAALRGAFIGLNRQHGAADLAWAVLEGIAFLNGIVLERAEAASERAASEIRFGGGGACSPAWCQVKADICGRPVLVGAAAQPGVLGAAIVAWTGLGHFASLDEGQARLVKIVARYWPRPERAEFYRALRALYRRSEMALAPISRDLAALSGAAMAKRGCA